MTSLVQLYRSIDLEIIALVMTAVFGKLKIKKKKRMKEKMKLKKVSLKLNSAHTLKKFLRSVW